MPAAYMQIDKRFTRIGEAMGSAIGSGSYGHVFQGYDELKQRTVFIKRQKTNTQQAAQEHACYNMLAAYPHPNIVQMCGVWTSEHLNKSYLYIAMESCRTNLWKFIQVDNPRT